MLETGTPVRSPETLARIDALRIPPAYRDVRIAANARSAIQAWGFDARGRRQYRYHARAIERGERRKFRRVAHLARDLAAIRVTVARDLRARGLPKVRVAAGVVRLIRQGYLRIGEDRYERENHTFGATTLRKTHVTVDRTRIEFDYPGKRGIRQQHTLADPQLARLMHALRRIPGRRLFRYQDERGWSDLTSRDVNQYLRHDLAVPYTAKDFRTWGGTLHAAIFLADAGPASTRREARRTVVAAARAVAEMLGNTPAISRKSYIHPIVVALYLDRGLTIAEDIARARGKPGHHALTAEESALQTFLEEHFPDRRRTPRDGSAPGSHRRAQPVPASARSSPLNQTARM